MGAIFIFDSVLLLQEEDDCLALKVINWPWWPHPKVKRQASSKYKRSCRSYVWTRGHGEAYFLEVA